MIRVEKQTISGKDVANISVTDCKELEKKVLSFIDVMNGVDTTAMDGHARNLNEIKNDVIMGIIGHIIVCELIKLERKPCELHFDIEGFHLTSNSHSIKVRTSLAQVPPCPQKHIEKFTITGYEEGDIEYDYYVQIVFCEIPRIGEDNNCINGMYIVGGVEKQALNKTKDYGKKKMKVADISSSQTLDQVISSL
jgi:hypothetical protein